MILMIDNYDSFTHNLVQYLMELEEDVAVYRNDAITTDQIAELAPAAIVISPGPGRPESAGVSVETIQRFSGQIPLLGVCLGHQSIGQAFGAKIIHAKAIMHGKTSMVTTDGETIYQGLSNPLEVMRYHSLVIDETTLPEELIVTARSDDNEVMGIRHAEHPTEGVQFHPESIKTPAGKRMLRNFLKTYLAE
jgi:anthranilate synthase/aminodeoxychorismate synthase-like glutamine amidotransferase